MSLIRKIYVTDEVTGDTQNVTNGSADVAVTNIETVEDGDILKVYTKDINLEPILTDILKELKKIEYHLSIASDTDLTNL